jgi:hypothetical protein
VRFLLRRVVHGDSIATWAKWMDFREVSEELATTTTHEVQRRELSEDLHGAVSVHESYSRTDQGEPSRDKKAE